MTGTGGVAGKPSTAQGNGRQAAAGYLLTAAVLLIPYISFGEVPWLTGPFALIVAAALWLNMFSVSRKRALRSHADLLRVPLALALGLSVLHLFRSPVPYSSLLFLAQLSLSVAFYYLTVSGSSLVKPLTAVLLWTSVLVPWVAVKILYLGPNPPVGPFMNPNYSATVLLVCLAVILGSTIGPATKKRPAALLLVAALLCSATLMLIGSRSAGLGMVLLWIVFMIFRKGSSRWLAVVVIAMIVLFPNMIRHRVTEGYKVDPHAFSRLEIWKSALKMGADHPLLGVGPYMFNEYGPRYAFPTDELPVRYGRIARKPHNEFIKSWAEGGTAGVLILLLFLIAVWRMACTAVRGGRAGPVLAVGAILFQALFHDITEVFALMVLMAWCLAQVVPETDRESEAAVGSRWYLPVLAGALVLGFSLWMTVDLTSRSFWLKGRGLMESDPYLARNSLLTATVLNPILPGAARDLGRVEFTVSRQGGGGGAGSDRVEAITARARRLNRLDTVPLRLEAALYIRAAREGEVNPSTGLAKAAAKLREALLIEPYNALIMLSLSEVIWDLNQRGRAMEILEEAVIKEPNYLQAHRTRISWLTHIDRERVPWAEGELEKAKERAEGYFPQSDYEEIILR